MAKWDQQVLAHEDLSGDSYEIARKSLDGSCSATLKVAYEVYNTNEPVEICLASKTTARVSGGWGGIRTHGGGEPSLVFKTSALNHSATHPK